MARALSLDVSDGGLLGLAEGGAVLGPSPGCALVEGDVPLFGEEALRRSRLCPRLVASDFWSRLDAAPLGPPFPDGLSAADLVHGHLESLWAKAEAGTDEVVLAVPGVYDERQLGLLLGIAQALSMPVPASWTRRWPRPRRASPASACCTWTWACAARWSPRSARGRRSCGSGWRGSTAGGWTRCTTPSCAAPPPPSCGSRGSTRSTTPRPSRLSSTGCRPGSPRSSGTSARRGACRSRRGRRRSRSRAPRRRPGRPASPRSCRSR